MEHRPGTSDPERRASSGLHLVYDLASVSKVAGVATSVLFVCESGSLRLIASVSYLFCLREDDHPGTLDHTSGLDPFIPNRDH